MELLITLGRDSVVAYQNEASAKLKPAPLGASIIRNTFVLPCEEVRDSIFSGKTVSFSNRSLFHNDREFLLTRDYRPLCGPSGEVIGIISMGLVAGGADRRGIFRSFRYRFRPRISGTSQPIIRLSAACRVIPWGTLRLSSASSTTPAISAAASSLIPAARRVSSIATKTRLTGPGDAVS